MTENHDDRDREQQGENQDHLQSADSTKEASDSQVEHQEAQEEKKLTDQDQTEEQPAGQDRQSPVMEGHPMQASLAKGKPQPKSNLKKSLLIFFGILLGVAFLGLIGSTMSSSFSSDKEWTNPNVPYVAVVHVEGAIYSGQSDSFGAAVGYQHRWTLDRIDEFISDENNQGILLFVDSPGGGVYESDELYLKLKEYQDTDRPVYAAMGSMAASGGYYIAAAADQIYANRNTWTGSIGVTIGTLYDISDLLTRYGIKTATITAGKNKAMGSMVEPLTQEQRDIFQSLVDEAYEQFTEIVATERNLPLDVTRNLADGRIYTAKQALNAGLVDVIGTSEEALYDLFDDYELWDCEVIDVYYRDNSFWGRLFAKVNFPDGASSDIGALLNFVEQSKTSPISYECQILK